MSKRVMDEKLGSSKESDDPADSMTRARIRRKSPTRMAILEEGEEIGERERGKGGLDFCRFMLYGIVMVKGGEDRSRGERGRSVGGGEVRGNCWFLLFVGKAIFLV